jgi:hypothetical protein
MPVPDLHTIQQDDQAGLVTGRHVNLLAQVIRLANDLEQQLAALGPPRSARVSRVVFPVMVGPVGQDDEGRTVYAWDELIWRHDLGAFALKEQGRTSTGDGPDPFARPAYPADQAGPDIPAGAVRLLWVQGVDGDVARVLFETQGAGAADMIVSAIGPSLGLYRWVYTLQPAVDDSGLWVEDLDQDTVVGLNRIEQKDGSDGVHGNGVVIADLEALPGTWEIVPVPVGTPVRAERSASGQWWFQVPNGVNGEC